ncbi:MAG: response regulator [Desulfuromonadaceae bacterium]|nr:response regulator [Desulfuromonadaceae bacterium]
MINPSDILNAGILIVDDEEPNIILIERTLRGAGYTSITSTMNPHKVCELYRINRYDLILLDIRMPGMDGFQVMECLKEIEMNDYPPVLVITAEPEQKQRALHAGAKDFVSKPFELIEVLTRVHNMLEARLLQKEIEEHREDNPALSSVIQRNIRKIIHVRLKAAREQGLQDRIANWMTTFSGSMFFFYLHLVWFLLWFILNTGHLGMVPFDPYPYGFLTMVVSLEAIFLATFVLISQNLLAKEAERLTDLGLQTGLLTEHELTRVLQMLRAIQNKIGISNDEDSDLADADLEMETRPEDVLAEIERLQRRAVVASRLSKRLR